MSLLDLDLDPDPDPVLVQRDLIRQNARVTVEEPSRIERQSDGLMYLSSATLQLTHLLTSLLLQRHPHPLCPKQKHKPAEFWRPTLR